MRATTLSGTLAVLVLTAGCGAATKEAPAAAPSTSSATESSSPCGNPSDPSPNDVAASASDGPTVLVGKVGTPEDPDAFVIALTNEAGQPVTSVPAGDYQIQVSDPSEIHNFHFLGGEVNETTTVPEIAETTFDITLEAGSYTYLCDPHPSMVGKLSVT